MDVALRPVTKEDEAFLRAVYASTREEELRQVDWTAEQKAAFCEMQFRAQDVDYRKNYPGAQFLVIERGGVPAGRLYVSRGEKSFLILDIALLPEHRGAGIGTRLLKELMEEADAAGKTVRIHVEKFNPAQRLYRRLGFREVEDIGVYWEMEWRA